MIDKHVSLIEQAAAEGVRITVNGYWDFLGREGRSLHRRWRLFSVAAHPPSLLDREAGRPVRPEFHVAHGQCRGFRSPQTACQGLGGEGAGA